MSDEHEHVWLTGREGCIECGLPYDLAPSRFTGHDDAWVQAQGDRAATEHTIRKQAELVAERVHSDLGLPDNVTVGVGVRDDYWRGEQAALDEARDTRLRFEHAEDQMNAVIADEEAATRAAAAIRELADTTPVADDE